MNKREAWLKKVRRNVFIFLALTQLFGVIGAVLVANLLGSDFQSYLIGYMIGVIVSLGGTLGVS